MKFYRSHKGLVLGVCEGLAETSGIPAKYIRITFIAAALIFRAWIILALYLLCALLLPAAESKDWKIQDNFDSLGNDARRKAAQEYRELSEMVKKFRNPEAHSTSEESSPGEN